MTGAGEMNRRVTFGRRAAGTDDYGNEATGGFTADYPGEFARVHYLRGSEAVLAARLAGRQPAVVTVRDSSEMRQVRVEWRAVDDATGEVFNIRAVTPNDRQSEIDFLCEAGVGA